MAIRAIWIVSIVLVLSGCGAEAPPSEAAFFFPQHEGALGVGDAALLEGFAVLEDACFWIETQDGTRYLPIWPGDVELGRINDLPVVIWAERTLLMEVGDFRRLGGSEASAEVARELVGEIPDRCASGRFWVVSDVIDRQ